MVPQRTRLGDISHSHLLRERQMLSSWRTSCVKPLFISTTDMRATNSIFNFSTALALALALPLLRAAVLPNSHDPHANDHTDNPLPGVWYQEPGHPVHSLFKRDAPTDGTTYPAVGTPGTLPFFCSTLLLNLMFRMDRRFSRPSSRPSRSQRYSCKLDSSFERCSSCRENTQCSSDDKYTQHKSCLSYRC